MSRAPDAEQLSPQPEESSLDLALAMALDGGEAPGRSWGPTVVAMTAWAPLDDGHLVHEGTEALRGLE